MLFGIRFIGRPIRQLIEKTRAIGEGDLNTPLSLSGSDELGELALKLNTMCDELSASQNQVHEEAAARVERVQGCSALLGEMQCRAREDVHVETARIQPPAVAQLTGRLRYRPGVRASHCSRQQEPGAQSPDSGARCD